MWKRKFLKNWQLKFNKILINNKRVFFLYKIRKILEIDNIEEKTKKKMRNNLKINLSKSKVSFNCYIVSKFFLLLWIMILFQSLYLNTNIRNWENFYSINYIRISFEWRILNYEENPTRDPLGATVRGTVYK